MTTKNDGKAIYGYDINIFRPKTNLLANPVFISEEKLIKKLKKRPSVVELAGLRTLMLYDIRGALLRIENLLTENKS